MKVARDTWLVFGRYFGIFIHNPAWVALGVLQQSYQQRFRFTLLKEDRGFGPGVAYAGVLLTCSRR